MCRRLRYADASLNRVTHMCRRHRHANASFNRVTHMCRRLRHADASLNRVWKFESTRQYSKLEKLEI